MRKSLKIAIITIVAFALHFVFDDLYFKSIRHGLNEVLNQGGTSHIIAYVIVGIPIFIGTLLIGKGKGFFSSLGLNKNFLKALVFAALCTLPMFLGFALLFKLNTEISLNTFLISIVAAGFFEELYFRGFLFGQLYRRTPLGFFTSVFAGALLFGMVHLYQSNDPAELAGIFLITFLGAVLFAWAYAEWEYNIWVPVLLHALMNLAWELFSISDNALGGIYSNVFRTATIALIIGLTIWYKKRKGIPLEITRDKLWMKKQGVSVSEDTAILSA